MAGFYLLFPWLVRRSTQEVVEKPPHSGCSGPVQTCASWLLSQVQPDADQRRVARLPKRVVAGAVSVPG